MIERGSLMWIEGVISIATKGTKATLLGRMTGKPMTNIDFGPSDISSITFSLDGEFLAAAGEFGIKYNECSTFAFWSGEKLTEKQLWDIMGKDHAWNAYRSAWTLPKKPAWLDVIAERLQAVTESTPAEFLRLRAAMHDSDGKVVASAARMLLDLGVNLSEEEREGLNRPTKRIKYTIPIRMDFPSVVTSGISTHGPVPELLPLSNRNQMTRALMLLEADGSKKAKEILTRISKGYSQSPVTKQACRQSNASSIRKLPLSKLGFPKPPHRLMGRPGFCFKKSLICHRDEDETGSPPTQISALRTCLKSLRFP